MNCKERNKNITKKERKKERERKRGDTFLISPEVQLLHYASQFHR